MAVVIRLFRRRPAPPVGIMEGDRVWLKASASPHQVLARQGDNLLLTNMDRPMSRISVPVTWARPIPKGWKK